MVYLLNNQTFWLKTKSDTENVLSLFNDVISDDIDDTRHNSFCWKSTLKVHLDMKGLLTGKLGDHSLYSNGTRVLYDPRFYYHVMLKYRTGIIDPNGVNVSYLCIPRVYLAGFPKSGTSAVDSLLTIHPQIVHGLSKEPRWWAPPLKHPNQNKFRHSYEYFIKYILQYLTASEKAQKDRHTLLIDSSPNLLPSWSNVGFAEDFEDVCLLPVVMSLVLPNPLYIVILRDPIEFLYSRFWFSCSSTVYYNVSVNPSDGPYVFHSMVIRRLGIFSKCQLMYSIERCALAQAYIQDESNEKFGCGVVPLHFALYYVHVIKWFSVIPRRNFYITTYEKYFKSPFSTTREVWNFLNLEQPHVNSEVWNKRLEQGKNIQEVYDYHSKPELQMLPKTRAVLKEFLHPFNILLATLLGEKDYLWE